MKKEKALEYNITNDPNYINSIFPIPYELEIQLQDLHKLALKGKKSSIKKFNRLIEKYQKVPILKNYLSTVYQAMDNMEKANEVNKWLVKEHPNYLFGKVNLAAECISKKELQRVPEILGKNLDLKALYPDRNTFHANEVLTFTNICVRYFAELGDLEQANDRLELMLEIDEFSKQVNAAREYILYHTLRLSEERIKEVEKSSISVKQKTEPKNKNTKQPTFTHPEINVFYEKDLSVISNEEINQVLSLPRKSLIKDLNTVLDDAINRYNYFRKIEKKENNWDGNKYSFLLHSFFFLSELKSKDSTDKILEILRQNSKLHEFYLYEFLTEFVWEIIYQTSDNKLDVLQNFMCEPNINTYAKTEISEAVLQIYYHNPDRKEEIINWYENIFNFYINSDLEDNVIDSELLGLIMAGLMDAQLKELIPSAEKLFNKNYVGTGICGDFDEFVSEINSTKSRDYKRPLKNIYELYGEIKSFNTKEFEDIDDETLLDEPKPILNDKVGRNDPCPCGSGKKYKKCCLNK